MQLFVLHYLLAFGLDLCWFYSCTLHPEDVMSLGIWTAICFMLLEYSCLLLESIFVIYQSYGRLLKVRTPKMVMAACNLLSAVLKYQKLWKLQCFANSFSDNARAYFATWGLPQKTLLGVVCKVQCVHHMALLKCKVFCIPNHIWSQRLWIRDSKPLLIRADFFPFQLCVLCEFLLTDYVKPCS